MVNVILCGGAGTRLWPLSRAMMPKQFLKLFADETLFGLTLSRNSMATKHLIVCNEANYFTALDECRNLNNFEFILEPFGKNTAGAIAMAALSVDADEILLITPSDHYIKDKTAYINSLDIAVDYAKNGFIVTFGITPTMPHTGYGYIKAKGKDVVRFIEKPSLELAQSFLKEGGYYFNSGMFCFRARDFLEQFDKYCPEILSAAKNALQNSDKDENVIKISPKDMSNIEDISIDYAFMQRACNIAMVPLDAGWSDMGSFDELSQVIASSKFESVNAKGNFVISDKLVGIVGVDDVIVVDTKDALMIVKKGSSQDVKELYSKVSNAFPNFCETHTKVFRPWGSYEVLEEGNGFKIKRLVVLPGKRLSLQSHNHRSEHWVVVQGCAVVQINDNHYNLNINESIYIKQGDKHRLSNESDSLLIIIEAQVGEYLDENDITRYEDDFKRA